MSVINQVLLELEKRRASGAERGMLPDHVRALPDASGDHGAWRIAVGSSVAIILAGMAWLAVTGFGFPRPAAMPVPALPGTDAVIEKVVLASAGMPSLASSQEGDGKLRPVGRLSLELSSPPESAPQHEVEPPAAKMQAAIPASRVVSRAAPDGGSAADAPVAPPAAPPAVTGKVAPKASAVAVAAEAKGDIQKHERQPTPRELADNEYRKASTALQQGRLAEAQDGFRAALNINATHHAARQALVALQVESKATADAERTLQEGLKLAPDQNGFAMTLARLQVNRGDNAGAIATLQGGLGYAHGNPDYAAFLAALLQRQGRHEEAIEQFQSALRVKPTGVWWLGIGMSLQAVNRAADAQEAYRRAKATPNLSPELSAFADQRLRQLQ